MKTDATDPRGAHDSIRELLTADHDRLDGLLRQAFADPDRYDPEAYDEFRSGLLRHISMEEKILLPAAQAARGGQPLEIATRLRLDHGALAALLVPPPTRSIAATLRAIFAVHNPLEEGRGGLYDICDTLLADRIQTVLAELKATPQVKMAPFNPHPAVLEVTRRALARAGYEMKSDE